MQSSSSLVRDDCSLGVRWHLRQKRKYFNISHIDFLAKKRKLRLRLDGFSREFIDLHDSPLPSRHFYLIHPQHFVQICPALEGPQKSSRIYLCSLHSKPAFRGWLFRLSVPRPEVRHQPFRSRLVIRHLQNARFPTLYYYARFGPGSFATTSP